MTAPFSVDTRFFSIILHSMPRQPRIVIPHIPHHITQHGNYRQTIFEEQPDYEQYCAWAQEYAEKYDLLIRAFCLMNNHVPLIVVPQAKDTLAKAINTLHMRYAQYMNKKHQVKGHLWQGRFFSSFLDEGYLYRAIRYVEQNPVRAGMVKEAWAYRWSSARVHAGRICPGGSSVEKVSAGRGRRVMP